MSRRAISFAGILRRKTLSTHHVHDLGHRLNVLRIDASSISTKMVECFFSDFPMHKTIRKTMGRF